MTMASTSLSPAEQDLSAIKIGEWGEREFPLGPRDHPTRRQVIFKQSVLNDVYTHGRSAPDIEVCGVLVGNVYHDAMGPFVFVEANIRGNFSSGKAAQVTFTAKTWSHIQDVMDKDFPDLRILGWYHTHPGHGIFLSDMDLFIHKNFFSLPWHLAFVFDPQNQEEGLFAWRTGNMLIESFVVQKDAPPATPKVARRVPEFPPNAASLAASANAGSTVNAPAVATAERSNVEAGDSALGHANVGGAGGTSAAGPRAAQSLEVTELAMRVQTLEKRQRWYTVAMAVVVLVAVAWPVVFSAIAVLNAPDDSLGVPPTSHSTAAAPHAKAETAKATETGKAVGGNAAPGGTAAGAANSKRMEEAAVMNAASVETDPEARP